VIMDFRYSDHFQARLIEQGIRAREVKEAVRHPDSIEEVYGGRTRVTKSVGGKTLAVVYISDSSRGQKNCCVLITAYYKDGRTYSRARNKRSPKRNTL
jgi:hypothetical protein